MRNAYFSASADSSFVRRAAPAEKLSASHFDCRRLPPPTYQHFTLFSQLATKSKQKAPHYGE